MTGVEFYRGHGRKRLGKQGYFKLFHLLVLILRFDQNRNVRIGIFPQREEILIRLARFRRVALQYCRAAKSEMRERIERREGRPAAVIQNLLKLAGCLRAFPFTQVGLATQIVLVVEAHAFIAADGLQHLDGLGAVAALHLKLGADQGQVDLVDDCKFRILLDRFVTECLRLGQVATQRQSDADSEEGGRGAGQGRRARDLCATLLALPQDGSQFGIR